MPTKEREMSSKQQKTEKKKKKIGVPSNGLDVMTHCLYVQEQQQRSRNEIQTLVMEKKK